MATAGRNAREAQHLAARRWKLRAASHLAAAATSLSTTAAARSLAAAPNRLTATAARRRIIVAVRHLTAAVQRLAAAAVWNPVAAAAAVNSLLQEELAHAGSEGFKVHPVVILPPANVAQKEVSQFYLHVY